MRKEHTNTNPAPRRGLRGLIGVAALLPAVLSLMFAACDDNPTSESFDGLANGYVVTFNKNGAEGDVPNTIVATRNGLITLPGRGSLTKSGYNFAGWSSTPSTSGTLYQAGQNYYVSGDCILYARWNFVSYTISFNANGGSVYPTSATTGSDGRLTSLPTPTRSGYTFDGWYTSSSGGSPVSTYYVFSGNTTIYAHWTANPTYTYTITFDANGGSVSPTSATTNSNGYLTSLPTPTRSGYTFAGWYTEPTGGTVQVTTGTMFLRSLTLYAYWTPNSTSNTYTITLNANGGTLSGGTSVTTGTNGRLTSLPVAPTRTGYTFSGWYTSSSGGTQITTSYTFSANTTIYAQWTANPVSTTYTITLNANGGTLSGGTSVTTGTNGRLTSLPAAPTRTGYMFNGWYTSSSGGTQITMSYTFSANTTIYAQWTANPVSTTYTITLNANGGSVSPTSATTNASGNLTTSLPTPTRTGYTFNGWYTSSSGGTQITTSYTFAANTTIYAQWTVINYEITYTLNGGTVTSANRTNYNVEMAAFTLNNPTRGGYAFDGWTGSNGTTPQKTVTISAGATGNKNYTANWTAITVTFNANGGSVSPASAQVSADGRLTNLPTPTKSGSTFSGWTTASGSSVTASTVFTESVTIFAQWTTNITYTITFDANGGTVGIPSASTNEYFKLVSLPTPEERSGYIFDGWYTAAAEGEVVTEDYIFSANATIYAHWTPDSPPDEEEDED